MPWVRVAALTAAGLIGLVLLLAVMEAVVRRFRHRRTIRRTFE